MNANSQRTRFDADFSIVVFSTNYLAFVFMAQQNLSSQGIPIIGIHDHTQTHHSR